MCLETLKKSKVDGFNGKHLLAVQVVSGGVWAWDCRAEIIKHDPWLIKKQHHWSVHTQRELSRYLKQLWIDLLLKVVFLSPAGVSYESVACESIWPQHRFFFTLSLSLLWIAEHIPDDYRNSTTTFMIVIITRPLPPCSCCSWENGTVYCSLRGENSCSI